MTPDPLTVHELTAPSRSDVAGLAAVLLDCVAGGASVSFMADLTPAQAEAFWQGVADDVQAGKRALLVARDAAGAIVGTVQLVLSQPDNQPHRADLAKMLVHRRARRQGLAERLMRAAEALARERGKSLLVLDTVTGGDAERLYTRLDWQRVGVIPDYALWPDGRYCATTVFFKRV
ncbi:GNAT family N-acetyltransferase [Ideonella sp. DXS22W]|uniref:GNAT family N-acetyltransferase n=1 Tax=Pseudaquabacterium inlustre TaxID=2984192 RepID=A0ABU9CKB9_9BURK